MSLVTEPPSRPVTAPPVPLAIISNVATPYRLHFHQRLVIEIPEICLHSLFTHEAADFRWDLDLPAEIRPISFALTAASPTAPPWRTLRADLRRIGPIWRYLTRHRIRAVFFLGYNNATLLGLLRRCKRAGMRTFLLADSNIAGEAVKPRLVRWMKRQILPRIVRQFDGILPMGRLGQQYFEFYGADPRRCFWSPYEPDYDYYAQTDPRELANYRSSLNWPSSRKRVLFAGRLVPVKRIDLLLDAFRDIAAERPDWDLAIAGDGPLWSALSDNMPPALRGRVFWLGFCDPHRLRLCYHACHVLALPSDDEPWGVVVNEAMAAGLPVVASDAVGAAHELVNDGDNGRIFTRGDVPALRAALLDITDELQYPRFRSAVGTALAGWRAAADPVAGVRAALRSVGLIPHHDEPVNFG